MRRVFWCSGACRRADMTARGPSWRRAYGDRGPAGCCDRKFLKGTGERLLLGRFALPDVRVPWTRFRSRMSDRVAGAEAAKAAHRCLWPQDEQLEPAPLRLLVTLATVSQRQRVIRLANARIRALL
eukprot:Amastigsp_a859228_22.p2 type:complete len:126 gc:universal Amastigsp_a859228_22:652-275(-)